jgi:hypothetical protein
MVSCVCVYEKAGLAWPGFALVALRLARMPRPEQGDALASLACHACGCASPVRARFCSMPDKEYIGYQWFLDRCVD